MTFVSMKRLASWEVSDAFWSRVEPLIPVTQRDPKKEYQRKPGAERKPKAARTVFAGGIVHVLRTGRQWKALPKEVFGSSSAIHKRFLEWEEAGVFLSFGKAAWPSMTKWKALPGHGRASTKQWSKPRWPRNLSGATQRIGEKNGSKRNRLTDGRGVPLFVVVCGANRHDVKSLPEVLDAIVTPRPPVTEGATAHETRKIVLSICAQCAIIGNT
jgi:hypothetical protein